MTTKKVDYYFCEKDGQPQHDWAYRGRLSQTYRCNVCAVIVTKAALRENTN